MQHASEKKLDLETKNLAGMRTIDITDFSIESMNSKPPSHLLLRMYNPRSCCIFHSIAISLIRNLVANPVVLGNVITIPGQ